jgi:hypothetical protein
MSRRVPTSFFKQATRRVQVLCALRRGRECRVGRGSRALEVKRGEEEEVRHGSDPLSCRGSRGKRAVSGQRYGINC